MRLSGEYTSSCGYCGSVDDTSVSFGMTATRLTVQVCCPTIKHNVSRHPREIHLLCMSETWSFCPGCVVCMVEKKLHLFRTIKTFWTEAGGAVVHGCTCQSTTRPAVSATLIGWIFLNSSERRRVPCYTASHVLPLFQLIILFGLTRNVHRFC